MRKLIVFNHLSLDGFITSPSGDFRWASAGNDSPEYAAFVAENARKGGELLFGRVTYELMASYWPTTVADQHHPDVAKGMNAMPKVVFSRTLNTAAWNNTRLLKGDLVSEVRKLKEESGPGMAIMGSASIVSQLAPHNLVDEYQFMIDPVALGGGKSMFQGIPEYLHLKLAKSRVFDNGKVSLSYEAAASS
jgi:dihydrofolate reductase